jgi:molybdopterin converting factor small subunit
MNIIFNSFEIRDDIDRFFPELVEFGVAEMVVTSSSFDNDIEAINEVNAIAAKIKESAGENLNVISDSYNKKHFPMLTDENVDELASFASDAGIYESLRIFSGNFDKESDKISFVFATITKQLGSGSLVEQILKMKDGDEFYFTPPVSNPFVLN